MLRKIPISVAFCLVSVKYLDFRKESYEREMDGQNGGLGFLFT